MRLSRLAAVAVTAVAVVAVLPAVGADAHARAQGGQYTVKAKIKVEHGPIAVVVDSWASKLYVANSLSGSVSVISTVTDKVVKTIKLGGHPQGLAVDVRTRRVFVACSGDQVVVIGVKSDKVIARIKLGGDLPDIAVNPVTDRVYVPVATPPGLAGEVAVINGSTNHVIASIKVDTWLSGIAVNTRTNRIYAASSGHILVIDGSTNTVTLEYWYYGASELGRVAINQRTNTTYIVASGSDVVVAVKGRGAGRPGTIATGHYPYGIAVNQEAGILYVACVLDGTVWMIDATTGKKLASVGTDPGPDGIAYFGNTIYEVNRDRDTVWVISTPASR